MNSTSSGGIGLYELLSIPAPEEGELHNRVRRYIDAPSAVEHETLRRMIESFYGSAAARFFDEECTLPLSSRAKFPDPNWPIHPWEAASIRSTNVVAVFVTIVALSAVSISGGLGIWTLLVALLGGTAASIAVRQIRRQFPPLDLPERARLVSKFVAMAAQQEALDELERERAEAEAEADAIEARAARLRQSPATPVSNPTGPTNE